jgi:signal transduction histidine kinase
MRQIMPRLFRPWLSPALSHLPGDITPLPRNLSSFETLGFSFSGLLLWLGIAPSMHLALGSQAILVWLVATVAGVMLNLQVKHLGSIYPDVAGGTPNYTTRLWQRYPAIARYTAIGYWIGWVSVPPINAIILTDLIESHLEALGIACPAIALRIAFTGLPYALAFSGTRALGILHAFFIVPAVGLLLAFCIQGFGWLALPGASHPGIMPTHWQPFSLSGWTQWYFMAVYAVYGCETGSSFVADSRRPRATLNFMALAASILPIVYIGGSWLLLRLAPTSGTVFEQLTTVASRFWGQSAALWVTFLITSGCLLSSATAVSNTPRILYQLSLDRHLAPVFGVVSRRGVFAPGLCLTLLLSLLCLAYGNVDRVVMITGTSYLCAMIGIHWGIWLNRGTPLALFPRWSLAFFGIECLTLGLGGVMWSWQDLCLGLLLPVIILGLNAMVARSPWAWFQPAWWLARDQPQQSQQKSGVDFLFLQVLILLIGICGSTSISWWLRGWFQNSSPASQDSLFVVFMMTIALVGVAIAGWTSLPQIVAMAEAKEAAEVAQRELHHQKEQLQSTLTVLQQTQSQLVQQEKMSSLGQMVAGIAHEINNPVNFIHGNLSHINEYSQDLLRLLSAYQQHYPNPPQALQAELEDTDLDFLNQDLIKILHSMKVGSDRIRQIVISLRNFSRLDEADLKPVDLHEGIDNTLMILQHRLKATTNRPAILVEKQYGDLPLVECYAGQINQVFMNLLANAIDALEESNCDRSHADIVAQPNTIRISTTQTRANWVQITIADNGTGMPDAVRSRLFNPFFTTKPVGKGTGLGLSISYQVIAEKHGGNLWCNSTVGVGTTFGIDLPERSTAAAAIVPSEDSRKNTHEPMSLKAL